MSTSALTSVSVSYVIANSPSGLRQPIKTVSKSPSRSWHRLTGTGGSPARLEDLLMLMDILIRDRIEVNYGFICAQAEDQWKLGDMLDSIVLMILDKGLHNVAGVTTKIFSADFFLN